MNHLELETHKEEETAKHDRFLQYAEEDRNRRQNEIVYHFAPAVLDALHAPLKAPQLSPVNKLVLYFWWRYYNFHIAKSDYQLTKVEHYNYHIAAGDNEGDLRVDFRSIDACLSESSRRRPHIRYIVHHIHAQVKQIEEIAPNK